MTQMMWVKWNDAASYRGWRVKEGCSMLKVETLGWLIEDTKEYLMLAMDRSNDEGSNPWAEIEIIPKGMILETRVLRKG